VIRAFADKATEDVFHGNESRAARAFPSSLWPLVRRKLDMLHAAHDIHDLRVPPGNRLEKPRGDRRGMWSSRVSDQYRVVFRFEGGAALDVQLVDYHEEFLIMIPKHRAPTSPGEILLEEFWGPLGMTQVALAEKMGVPLQRVNTLVNGKRGVTAETAILLADVLGTTPGFSMNLQVSLGRWTARRAMKRTG